ncbi:MAG: caspase family protein [Burkholderiales bacterium]|nr:caspase family protein [Burkholderiales bacterium]
MNDSDYGVVVGISKYGSIKPELEGPERDATVFSEWLLSSTGGGVPKANVQLILSSQFQTSNAALAGDVFGYEPTLARVTSAFAKLMAMTVRNAQKAPRVGRRLYIYLSGHGITPRSDPLHSLNNSGLLMANCIEDVIYDHIGGQAYAEWFRLSHAFNEILLFMDCCRTDKPDVPPATITTPVVQGGRVNEVQVFYAWATQWDTRAWEQPLGTPPQKRGVFTYALVEALQQASDEQGHVTPRGIVGHLDVRIPQLRNGDASQRPQFHPPAPDARIILARQVHGPAATNLTITFAAALAGQEAQLQDGAFNLLHVRTVDAQPWTLSLKPGAYVLRVAGKDRPISVRPAETKTDHVPEQVHG